MKNRDMFYQNLNQGYQNPGYMSPPNGYSLNSQYQAYGPNTLPEQNEYYNDYEARISKLERQIKNIDLRLQKLENSTSETITDNVYMI